MVWRDGDKRTDQPIQTLNLVGGGKNTLKLTEIVTCVAVLLVAGVSTLYETVAAKVSWNTMSAQTTKLSR